MPGNCELSWQTWNVNRNAYLGHSTIYRKVLPIDKRAFIARKEQHSVSLFNSLPKPAHWKVNLAAVPFGFVVA